MEKGKLITPSELVDRMSLTRRRVVEMARTGIIPVVRLNARTLRFHWPTVAKKLKLAAAVVLVAGALNIAEGASAVTHRFLDAVAHVESGNDPNAVGDAGRSLGAYQLGAAAWADATLWRQRNKLNVFDYTNANHPQVSRVYAASYLERLREWYKARTGREPGPGELYAAYNCGPSAFRSRYKMSVANTPATTRRAVRRIHNFMWP